MSRDRREQHSRGTPEGAMNLRRHPCVARNSQYSETCVVNAWASRHSRIDSCRDRKTHEHRT